MLAEKSHIVAVNYFIIGFMPQPVTYLAGLASHDAPDLR
jgi:hypothetical protein